eukprot:TRINITY_DN176_c0_g1_i4.p2 TRINITY_DN176_c0_g1~~TRINITY_DN176_c0_g1_i4.p2  ORF type:complete len:102 (-),score=0.65 TRINITY_DN176_c0_g1_i4:676-981(-)
MMMMIVGVSVRDLRRGSFLHISSCMEVWWTVLAPFLRSTKVIVPVRFRFDSIGFDLVIGTRMSGWRFGRRIFVIRKVNDGSRSTRFDLVRFGFGSVRFGSV